MPTRTWLFHARSPSTGCEVSVAKVKRGASASTPSSRSGTPSIVTENVATGWPWRSKDASSITIAGPSLTASRSTRSPITGCWHASSARHTPAAANAAGGAEPAFRRVLKRGPFLATRHSAPYVTCSGIVGVNPQTCPNRPPLQGRMQRSARRRAIPAQRLRHALLRCDRMPRSRRGAAAKRPGLRPTLTRRQSFGAPFAIHASIAARSAGASAPSGGMVVPTDPPTEDAVPRSFWTR